MIYIYISFLYTECKRSTSIGTLSLVNWIWRTISCLEGLNIRKPKGKCFSIWLYSYRIQTTYLYHNTKKICKIVRFHGRNPCNGAKVGFPNDNCDGNLACTSLFKLSYSTTSYILHLLYWINLIGSTTLLSSLIDSAIESHVFWQHSW